MQMQSAPRVKCPCCGTEVVWSEASIYRPFCSERCKTIDLGAWASERYAIPGETGESDATPPAADAASPEKH
jgi:uncharacterized protein